MVREENVCIIYYIYYRCRREEPGGGREIGSERGIEPAERRYDGRDRENVAGENYSYK